MIKILSAFQIECCQDFEQNFVRIPNLILSWLLRESFQDFERIWNSILSGFQIETCQVFKQLSVWTSNRTPSGFQASFCQDCEQNCVGISNRIFIVRNLNRLLSVFHTDSYQDYERKYCQDFKQNLIRIWNKILLGFRIKFCRDF